MSDIYNLVVIGGGAAGLTASAFIGEAGGKVALIEKEKLGGDCTWVGCVPSKALLKVAKVAHTMRTADKYGISGSEPQVDMAQVKAHVLGAVEHVYADETPEVFSERGVEVIEGQAAQFVDAHTVQVGDRTLTAKKFVIATGARAAIPPIPGLDEVPYFTNENFFQNDRLPEHLIVLGAGAIGMEMSQAYSRLGAKVTTVGQAIMPRDDHDARRVLKDVFQREGITIIEDTITQFAMDGDDIVATLADGETLRGDMLLVAVGRAPTVDGLGLDNAGINYSKRGIEVDKYLRTNVPHIYAVGDCTTGPKLTHYAGFQGAVAGQNVALPVINFEGHTETFPWCTFTDPEVAQVGMTENAAREKLGSEVKVHTLPLTHGDRSVAEGETDGFIKIVYKGNGKLLGATVVAPRAGEMIQEFTNAMSIHSLYDITTPIHAYPTYSDIVKKSVSQVRLKELFDGTSGRLIDVASKVLF